MSKIALALLGFMIAGSPAEAATKNCKALKSPSARLKCYESHDSAAKPSAAPGKVEGTITWQYNNFIGTKGDVGAHVFLVRKPFDQTTAHLDPTKGKEFSGGLITVSDEDHGLFGAEADGFGKYSFDAVPPGEYAVFVFSSKTRPGPDDVYTNACKQEFGTFFQSFVFALAKSYCTSVTVKSAGTSTVSHDFGNTYF